MPGCDECKYYDTKLTPACSLGNNASSDIFPCCNFKREEKAMNLECSNCKHYVYIHGTDIHGKCMIDNSKNVMAKQIACEKYEQKGIKFDEEKLRWDLLPLDLINETVKVLTLGAKKYGPNNWQKVKDGIDRYYAALMRHITAYRSGEFLDDESGLTHLAHAMCNLIFLYALEMKDDA